MPKLPSDEDLWGKIHEGDDRALAELFDRYSNRLLRYGYTLTQDREVIKDCIQELFLDLWKRRLRIKTIHKVEHFVFKAFRRLIIRKTSRFIGLDETVSRQRESTPSPEEQLIEEETLKIQQEYLFEKIHTLPPRQSEIIFLRYYQGLGHKEIGEIMDLQPQGTWNLLSRAIKRLKEILQDPRCMALSGLILNQL